MAYGDIGSVIDTLQIQGGTVHRASIRTGPVNIGLAAYNGPDLDGYLCTFALDPDGNLGASVIDVWEFDGSFGDYPMIRRVKGNIYAMLYTYQGYYMQVFTFYVADDGTITKAKIDYQSFAEFGNGSPQQGFLMDAWDGIPNYITWAYCTYTAGPVNAGTLYILDDGTIAGGWVPSVQLTYNATDPHQASVNAPITACVYRDAATDIWLETHNFSGCIDKYEISPEHSCQQPKIVRARDLVFCVVHRGPGDDGFMKTIKINPDGTIQKTVLDSLEFDTANCLNNDVIQLANGVIGIPYSGLGYDGYLKTYPIDGCGNIGAMIDSAIYFSGTTDWHRIIRVHQDVYAIVFEGSGQVITIPIESEPEPTVRPHHEMIMGIGP